MSTEVHTRRSRANARRHRGFVRGFAIVIGVIVIVGAGAAAVGVVQGPRVTGVQVDPAAAITSSGSRLIVTTSQPLKEVDTSQVAVDPTTPFTVDTSGRSVGIRFVQPLWDDTTYTVTIDAAQGAGGGPESTIVQTFHTPPLSMRFLQRDAQDDRILSSDISGEDLDLILTAPHIEDFRATASHLVTSVIDEDERAALIVSDPEGGGTRPLTLPGEGFVSNLQASDRGEVIGYTFSDADLGEDGGLESALFTASLAAGAADTAPTPIVVEGADPRVAEWRFVPDTDSILLLGFDGILLLTGSQGGAATALGSAIAIEGVAGTDAIIERIDGVVVVDLSDGTETPLVTADDDSALGLPGRVTPVPGGGTLRNYGRFDESGLRSAGSTVAFVGDDGAVTTVADIAARDALIQVCASPSGRYAAVLVAPDAVSNRYDTYLLPMPDDVETRIVAVADGSLVGSLPGFDVSWCRVPPP